MGVITTPPPVIGVHCAAGDGILWPAGQTPRFIMLTAVDIVPCPIADYNMGNGAWLLDQVNGQPCVWRYPLKIHFLQVQCDAVGSIEIMQKRDAGGARWEFIFDGDTRGVDFNNDIIACNGWAGKLGTVHIDWV